ncbi:YheT family hydrolase [Coralloluteibacterium thermophilus]|uniref:YheT family hydrolase n=1 Tax=Coralloluteibacterium thermophilum TaxID=2707049 RepID=A0ABV9NGQ0_9GAMM
MHAADYRPPRWLRGGHVQSVLSSSALRRRRARHAFETRGATTREHLLDCRGVRLLGLHSAVPGRAPRGLVVLFHGWEGSAESGYMHATAAALLDAGYEVFRLNFRDHGDTHHLNEDMFHSCRLDEVVDAVAEVQRLFPTRPLLAAGFSLGGNFALRVARAAPAAGIALHHAVAVCPVLDPARGMLALERGLPLYHWYFMRKWRQSLRRKRALFPERYAWEDALLRQGMRQLTAALAVGYAGMADLDAYFEGYCIAGERLAGLEVPVSILTAADDPVIPVEDFHRLALPAHSRLEVSNWGGHCGFLENAALDGFAERWIAARMDAATAGVA